MSTTLTIRNLDQTVKLKLRVRAALHGRSMEAEAREILSREVQEMHVAETSTAPASPGKFSHFKGIWKGRMTTDEVMQLTRGE